MEDQAESKGIGEEIIRHKFWVIGVIAIMVLGGIVALLFKNSNEFGDSFGWVNALFSGFAFLGLIITLQMQREELKQNTQALQIYIMNYRPNREIFTPSVKGKHLLNIHLCSRFLISL